MISKETIIEFKEAIQEEYDKDISISEASLMLNDLVSYFDLLAKINNDIQNDIKNDIIYEPD